MANVTIENTRFIWITNFSGDPERDSFGSSSRKASLVIPDHMLARELIDEGFNVKMTKPREDDGDEFVPTYYVNIFVNFDSQYPPEIYLVSGNADPKKLTEATIDTLDKIFVENVDVVLNKHYNKRNRRWVLYVQTMYVTQRLTDDPFAGKYARRRAFDPADEEFPRDEVPFD